jgi:hypothetical protein
MVFVKSCSVPIVIFFALVFGIGCQTTSPNPAVQDLPAVQVVPQTDARPLAGKMSVGYTHIRSDGNRLVGGQGSMPDTQPVDVSLNGEPQWVVAVPTDDGSLWAVTLDDGRVQYFEVSAGRDVTEIKMSPDQISPDTPPALYIDDSGEVSLIIPDDEDAALVTHPVLIEGGVGRAYVDTEGGLVVRNSTGQTRLPINALPDARILTDEKGRLLLLTDASQRYRHGVLGDTAEAASITMVETEPEVRVVLNIPTPDDTVVEGIAPIWVDMDGDGVREIIVTLSNARQGAQIVVFNESGEPVAKGPAIGQGSRWRHQIAVAPFGPNGEMELVDVLTPHIGGVVEFYRLEGDDLRIIAQVSGFTSHVFGSRNLDMVVAGDFDGDGRTELLLPDQTRTELGAIRHTSEGAEIAWTLDLDERLQTNIMAVALSDGGMVVGIGMAKRTLRLWVP